jgi:hypothetical protein
MARVHFRRIDASLALLLAVAAPACGDSGGESASASASAGSATSVTSASSNVTGATEPAPTTSGSGSDSEGVAGSTGSGGATGTGSSTSGDLKLDVGINESTGGTGEPTEGCRKVDFLFVIDNSGSMSEEQDNLIASFPSFIQTIQQELKEAQDYHIMVVDSDAYVFSDCETICPLFFNLCPGALDDYQCGITKPEECEDVLGAGVIHPKGQSSSGKNCNFQSQSRYMDITEPDLTASFSCAAKVGTGSTDDPERPMQAMVAAVAPKGESTDCNLGFLRSDAILVVTFITDEDDDAGDGSNGTVEGWKASLIAAKKGDASALVVLGLFGDGDQVNPVCTKDAAEPSPRLRAFVDSFGDHGVAGSVCSPSYQTFFQEAVAIIDTTCDGFVPPPM